LCQKLNVEVPLDDFIAVDNDAIVVQELTEDEIVRKLNGKKQGIW
jgi:hypothetical protein